MSLQQNLIYILIVSRHDWMDICFTSNDLSLEIRNNFKWLEQGWGRNESNSEKWQHRMANLYLV